MYDHFCGTSCDSCSTIAMSWCFLFFFFFKQKTAYEMRISDWSSDVCSSDLPGRDGDAGLRLLVLERRAAGAAAADRPAWRGGGGAGADAVHPRRAGVQRRPRSARGGTRPRAAGFRLGAQIGRAPVLTPVAHAHLVCRLLLAKKQPHPIKYIPHRTHK